MPSLIKEASEGERIVLPVFNGRELTSVVSLKIGSPSEVTGVTEIWEPVGPYDEVRLTAGSFGKLERFQNVSSFVRFEKGNGLPGQVWQDRRALIQNELANHPGFLRAAGASAGSLQSAIGIPVFADRFLATVVLIGSQNSPIAGACEVWDRVEGHFELCSAFYGSGNDLHRFDVGQTMPIDSGLLGLAVRQASAVTTFDAPTFLDGRSDWTGFSQGLAIPVFENQEVTSVTILLF